MSVDCQAVRGAQRSSTITLGPAPREPYHSGSNLTLDARGGAADDGDDFVGACYPFDCPPSKFTWALMPPKAQRSPMRSGLVGGKHRTFHPPTLQFRAGSQIQSKAGNQ